MQGPSPFAPNNRQPARPVDQWMHESRTGFARRFHFVHLRKVRTWQVFALIIFLAGGVAALIAAVTLRIETLSDAATPSQQALMATIRNKGCIADGFLSGYGGDPARLAALLNRSQCLHLHRAIETWLAPPDFKQADRARRLIDKPGMTYGMFVAEAIPTEGTYQDPLTGRTLEFGKMCRPGSQGMWGEKTCKANFASPEYRAYVRSITRQGIDWGIQNILIGQIYFQDNPGLRNPIAPAIVKEIRDYAAEKGKTVVVGAQTGDIDDEKYLKLFDYIEGGMGIDPKGQIETGPCFSYRAKQNKNWCWPLMWHPRFADRAHNVLLHFDWSGLVDDDMSIYARMDRATRAKTILELKRRFTNEKFGFLVPYQAVVYRNNGGCHGPSPEFYTPDNNYSCRDENLMDQALELAGGPAVTVTGADAVALGFNDLAEDRNDMRFLSQTVPEEMVVGATYPVSMTLLNAGGRAWSDADGYRLGSQNPQDNPTWGGRAFLDRGETVATGQEKTFSFTVTAPTTPGIYNFQWQMLQEGTGWFGPLTPNLEIRVVPRGSEGVPVFRTLPPI